jgi:sugar O-acyltransferase (sialic acid O-acetyltransferase NeuD family)
MDVVLIGAGGHGRVVLDILLSVGQHRVVGVLDADPALAGTRLYGVEVLGPINLLEKLRRTHHVRGAIVAIGDNRVRRGYRREVDTTGLEAINAIHPAAHVSPRALLGRNVVVCAGAIVCTDATIGDSVILNTGCRVDHECVIGEAAHIAPGAILAGRVQVGVEAFIGLGASVIQCRSVGAGAVVAAGAVVIRDVSDADRVAGVPARPMKRP